MPPACPYHLTGEEKDQFAASKARAAEDQRTWPQRYEAMLIEIDRKRAAAEDDGLPWAACRRGPCENTRMARWNHGTGLPDPKACWDHLTAEESAALAKAEAELSERMERLKCEPACWSWPVPEAREYANEGEASDALHEWQHGRGCAICGPGWDLVEDHDHKTGLVRGNLCHSCNIKEGWGNGTPPFLKYIERNPASILGVKVRYWSPFTGYAEPEPVLTPEEEAEARRQSRAIVDRLSFPSPKSPRDTEPLPQETSET